MTEETSESVAAPSTADDYKSLALVEPEITNGKRVLSNGMSRGLRILKPEEVNIGRKTRWMELEVTGKGLRSTIPQSFRITLLNITQTSGGGGGGGW